MLKSRLTFNLMCPDDSAIAPSSLYCYFCSFLTIVTLIVLSFQFPTSAALAQSVTHSNAQRSVPNPAASSAQKPLSLDFSGLYVTASQNVKMAPSNHVIFNFGTVNPLEDAYLKQTFILRNDGRATLSGMRLQLPAMPGLQVLAATSGKSRSAPQIMTSNILLPDLLSGHTFLLIMSLQVMNQPAGQVNATAFVTLPRKMKPIAAIEMQATIQSSVDFSVPALNYGHIPAGQERVLPLRIELDPRLAPFGSIPKLYCSNPDIRIISVPLQEQDKRKSQLLNARQKATGLYSYLVMLPSDASIGMVSGTLQVVAVELPSVMALPQSKPSRNQPLSATVVADALRSTSIQITGQVIGDVSSSPGSVLFDSVIQGHPASRRIQLLVKDPKVLDGLQINSPVIWLSARLLANNSKASKRALQAGQMAQTLEVILSPQAPHGALRTQLTLTLASGQRLVLPIAAFVETYKTKP